MKIPPPFYLKVFTDKPFTTLCIQQWLDVANILKTKVFVICEKQKLINQIKNECVWDGKPVRESDITFFPADFSSLKPLAQELVVPVWVNAAVSHLTTFKHASENEFECFWNIDADDTFFSLTPHQIANVLQRVKDEFNNKSLNLCSLDMWHSLNGGRHWSFGVCLTRNTPNFFELLIKNKHGCHLDFKSIPEHVRNLDYFVTFLPRHAPEFKIGTFYVKNAGFTHFGLFLAAYPGVGTVIWHNKELLLPFIQGDLPYSFAIPDGTIEIDIGLHTPISINTRISPLSDLELKTLLKRILKYYFYYIMSKLGVKTMSFRHRAQRSRNQINTLISMR